MSHPGYASIFNWFFCPENFTIKRWWVSDLWNVKKMWVTDFVLERTCPEKHLNLSKSVFNSEEGHTGCKSQNIAIRALKRNFLCYIWFKWTYILRKFSQLVRLLWKNKFAFSDSSFTCLAVARWQDSMSRGQKSWFFLNFPHSLFFFVHSWTMSR